MQFLKVESLLLRHGWWPWPGWWRVRWLPDSGCFFALSSSSLFPIASLSKSANPLGTQLSLEFTLLFIWSPWPGEKGQKAWSVWVWRKTWRADKRTVSWYGRSQEAMTSFAKSKTFFLFVCFCPQHGLLCESAHWWGTGAQGTISDRACCCGLLLRAQRSVMQWAEAIVSWCWC